MPLAKVMFNFQIYCMQKYCYLLSKKSKCFFSKKFLACLVSCVLLFIAKKVNVFSAKSFGIFGSMCTRRLKESLTNDFVKVTML